MANTKEVKCWTVIALHDSTGEIYTCVQPPPLDHKRKHTHRCGRTGTASTASCKLTCECWCHLAANVGPIDAHEAIAMTAREIKTRNGWDDVQIASAQWQDMRDTVLGNPLNNKPDWVILVALSTLEGGSVNNRMTRAQAEALVEVLTKALSFPEGAGAEFLNLATLDPVLATDAEIRAAVRGPENA